MNRIEESTETRRRRIAEVFGDVLPDTTGDERDPEATDEGEKEMEDGDVVDQTPPE